MEAPETKELALVGKVELRIALADSDLKLESILQTYLAPLLLKLASEHMSVRNKVISICQHVNARIKPPSIKLPVAALLKQFKDIHNTLVRHFDLLYVQQGIDRLQVHERLELLPVLVRELHFNAQESIAHAASLFNILLKVIPYITLPTRGSEQDNALRLQLGFSDSPQDAEFLGQWFGKLILLLAGQTASKTQPGIGTEDYDFLNLYGKDDIWVSRNGSGMNLVETKISSIKFLASGAFTDSERFLPALFASADTNSRISDVGDDVSKRALSTVSLENPVLISTLFKIYAGVGGANGSLPARPPLQLKILGLLCRSKVATTFTSQCALIVEQGLTPSAAKTHVSESSTLTRKKQGLEASKLRRQIFSFTNWVARVGSLDDLKALAPGLVDRLRAYIGGQGWPQCRTDILGSASGEMDSRAYGYESIGLIARACSGILLLEPQLDLLRWLFDSLSGDASSKDVYLSIEGALGSVLGAFTGDLDLHLHKPLSDLLLHQMSLRTGTPSNRDFKVVRSSCHTTVRFANRCLPYASTIARWIDLLAIAAGSSERDEVLEEGRKGLNPYWYRILNPPQDSAAVHSKDSWTKKYQFPRFADVTMQFFGNKDEPSAHALSKLNIFNTSSALAYDTAVLYCQNILFHEALTSIQKDPVVDADWERSIQAIVAHNEDVRYDLRKYLNEFMTTNSEDRYALTNLIHAAFAGMVEQGGRDSEELGDALLDISALCPPSALDGLVPEILKIREPIFANEQATRERAAHFFGLIASHKDCSRDSLRGILDDFGLRISKWRQAIGSEVSCVHGAILATAYCISRSSYRNQQAQSFSFSLMHYLRNVLDVLAEARDKTLIGAAISAIDQLSLFGVLTEDAIPSPHTSGSLLETLKAKSETGDEKAIAALGHYAMLCSEDNSPSSPLQGVFQSLFKTHEIRQAEVQFAVGAALTCAAVGWSSKSLISTLDVEGSVPTTKPRTYVLQDLLERILQDCKKSKPALRQASVIWLLCLVQYCGHIDSIRTNLRRCQVAFKGFLADKDSLNQESASRGLTIVYEKGDRSLKDDLIRDLVGSFTGTDTRLAGNVSEETELFDPGALPTGDGSVTTYKDIMSLASEVGDPSLVYKFMSLASNNAIWSSRAAFGRFGLSNILSDSSVDGYLAQNPKIYPALYRYRFDPNPNVRRSMQEIWLAVVKDPTATIELHFDNILDDLLKSILGKEWRVREASCAAIADLVQGRPVERYERYLNEIWTLTFKVCDDIKESVRNAAMALARALTGLLTRSLEAGESSARAADTMLKNVIPFLLSPSGLESSGKEVQTFSLSALLQIIKSSSSKALRPFVPELVGRLLALLSSLEPQEINYLHLNADKYGMTPQQIDDVRLTSVKTSPMMEAIERCLDFLDERTTANLVRSLEDVAKTSVGLPSKVGFSRVLVTLSTRHSFHFRSHADIFLRLLQKQVQDRNETIASSHAVACGYLARLATHEELLKLMTFCKTLYFGADDERPRCIAGEIIYATSKHATDRFASFAEDILPFVFVAKHDTYERAKDIFQDTWNENVGGSRAVLLYLKEIIELISQHLDSPRWSTKHTCALAVAEVINSSSKEFSSPDAEAIWPTLDKSLSGKTWEGKEVVLQALVNYAKNTNLLQTKRADQMQIIIIRESKRNNMLYRKEALACLGHFVTMRDSVNLYPQVYSTVAPVFEAMKSNSDNEMDIDSSGGPSSKVVVEETLANAIGSLLKSINPKAMSELELTTSLSQTLSFIVDLSSRRTRTIQDAIYDCEKVIFGKLNSLHKDVISQAFEDVLIGYAKTVLQQDDQWEQTRGKAADAATAMAPYARKGSRLRVLFDQEGQRWRAQERAYSVQQSLDNMTKVLGSIK